MDFYVHANDGHRYRISGHTVIDAIEKNFSTIARNAKIGNGVGYVLTQVTAEYKDSILNGKGGIALSIRATGSDVLVAYDEDNDPERITEVWIEAEPENLQEKHEFELAAKDSGGEQSNSPESQDSFLYGNIYGLLDQISRYHVELKDEEPFEITDYYDLRFPNLLRYHPDQAVSRILRDLQNRKLDGSKECKAILDEIKHLQSQITNPSGSLTGEELIGKAKIVSKYVRAEREKSFKALRKNVNKTQQQVADEAKITLRQYQRYESGERSIRSAKVEVAQRLASVLGVTLVELCETP